MVADRSPTVPSGRVPSGCEQTPSHVVPEIRATKIRATTAHGIWTRAILAGELTNLSVVFAKTKPRSAAAFRGSISMGGSRSNETALRSKA